MICYKCKRYVAPEDARHCPSCGNDYCPDCASELCDCAERLAYYN